MDVQIYLDGKGRKFKSSTDTSRRKRRNKLWVNLEEFCKTGKFEPSSLASPAMKKLPSFSMKSKNNTPPPEFFLETFPIPCALLTIFELEIERWDQQQQLNQQCFWDASSSHGICGGVALIKCEDEADVHVARASADDVRGMTFAVGWDTDYLVFGYNGNEDGSHGHVKYVPLPSLSLFGDDEDYYHNCGRGVLEATVITRADVANILNLPNEDAVIELSILLGNDYTGDFVFSGSRPLHLTRISGTISHSFCSPVESIDDGRYILDEIKEEGYEEAVISYLNEMGANYLVEANQNSGDSNKSNEDPTMAIDFTRELFSFRDISTFPCDKGSHDTKDSSDAKTSYSTILDQRDKIVFATRTQLLDFALLPFREGLDDDGGGDDVCYYRDITPYGRILIQPEHLQAIEGALRNDGLIRCNDCYVETTQPSKFLNWNCILAGIAFERQLRSTVTACFRGTGSVISEIVSEGLPWLDYTTMHEIFLSVSNEGLESNASSLHLEEGAAIPHQRTKRASNRQEPLESRCKLPIDNHEEQILRSVRDRQITIIHGETG